MMSWTLKFKLYKRHSSSYRTLGTCGLNENMTKNTPNSATEPRCSTSTKTKGEINDPLNIHRPLTFLRLFPKRESSTLMWLKSRRRVPLGPFTITVRPFRRTLTEKKEKINCNTIYSNYIKFLKRHHVDIHTFVRDVNSLIAENGLHFKSN